MMEYSHSNGVECHLNKILMRGFLDGRGWGSGEEVLEMPELGTVKERVLWEGEELLGGGVRMHCLYGLCRDSQHNRIFHVPTAV